MPKWMSPKPEKCDICKEPIEDQFVDGATVMGPWAIMCSGCHFQYGRGTGTGKGQVYDAVTLEKVKG